MAAISVIVPVYRAEKFLRTCTDSILGQTCGDLELLLVEDGSPDASGELCDQIAAADSRVRVFHKENGGASSARNLGLEHARGRYVCFVDSDDWIAPNMLGVLLSALEDHGADTAGCGVRHVGQDMSEGVAEPPVLPAGVYEKDEIMTGVTDRLLGERLAQPVLKGYAVRFLYTRALLEGMEFHGVLQEDELFLLEYMCRAKRLVTVDEPMYYYYDNADSLIHGYQRYRPDYPELFSAFLREKDAVVARCGIGERMPKWRENTCWEGLLSIVANELAPGNGRTLSQQAARLRKVTEQPEMAQAIRGLVPTGMGRNRQLSAALLRRRCFRALALLYRVKNRGK